MNLNRTKYCGEISSRDIGKRMTVCGWVQKQRDLGKLIFVDLRDRTGIIQLVFYDKLDSKIFKDAFSLRGEFVIAVSGVVRERSSKNHDIPTGDVEIEVDFLKIYSKANTTPFEISDNLNVSEELCLKYRYLDIRRGKLLKNIVLRHKIAKITRDYFDKNNFIEIETPFLVRSTPEGARDYVVPSRVFPGNFFALPQSPQLYKQLIMIAGLDRYMQIVKCFRDEDLRSDRQPEFTQIDIEMSFVDSNDIMNIVENFIIELYGKVLLKDVNRPFLRLTYDECMKRFGSDKPDLRFEMELIYFKDFLKDTNFKVFKNAIENGGTVCGINAKGASDKFSRKEIDKLSEWIKAYGARSIFFTKSKKNAAPTSSFEKFLTNEEIDNIRKLSFFENGDILFLIADENELTCMESVGALRLEIAKKLSLIDLKEQNFLWVTDFPLFEYNKEQSRFIAKHHPFTSPKDEDLKFWESNPEKVHAKAFDLVLNGCEIGGGSIRISDVNLQKKMFNFLSFSKEESYKRFGFLLDALCFGAPPHGGFAFGFDRLVMLILGCESIREVIAFPKASTSAELMSDSPNKLDKEQLRDLSIKFDD